MTTDNEGSMSNGGADAKQQKDASEVKEVDAENKPEESNGPESTSKKSPACKITSHTYCIYDYNSTLWAALVYVSTNGICVCLYHSSSAHHVIYTNILLPYF